MPPPNFIILRQVAENATDARHNHPPEQRESLIFWIHCLNQTLWPSAMPQDYQPHAGSLHGLKPRARHEGSSEAVAAEVPMFVALYE